MSKQTIKEYATKNKISIFNVMKMVKSQKLKTISEVVDGKEIVYIVDDNLAEKSTNTQDISKVEATKSLEDEVESLKQEVAKLRSELNRLKVTVFRMGKQDAKILKI